MLPNTECAFSYDIHKAYLGISIRVLLLKIYSNIFLLVVNVCFNRQSSP